MVVAGRTSVEQYGDEVVVCRQPVGPERHTHGVVGQRPREPVELLDRVAEQELRLVEPVVVASQPCLADQEGVAQLRQPELLDEFGGGLQLGRGLCRRRSQIDQPETGQRERDQPAARGQLGRGLFGEHSGFGVPAGQRRDLGLHLPGAGGVLPISDLVEQVGRAAQRGARLTRASCAQLR